MNDRDRQPQPNFRSEWSNPMDRDVEILFEDDEGYGEETEDDRGESDRPETTEEILERLEQIEQGQQKPDDTAQTVRSLVEAIQSRPEAVASTPSPQDTERQIREELKKYNDKYFDNPAETTYEIISRILPSVMARQSEGVLSIGKEILRTDRKRAKYVDRWGDEIDRELSAMTQAEKAEPKRALENAYKRVVANHLDEILAEQEAVSKDSVADQVKTVLQEMGVAGNGQNRPARRSTPGSGGGLGGPPPAERPANTIRAPRGAKRAEWEADARRRGIPFENYVVLRQKGVIQ